MDVEVTRRGFLFKSAGVLITTAGLPLVEACTAPPAAAPTPSGPAAAPTSAAAPTGAAAAPAPTGATSALDKLMPTYVPNTSLPPATYHFSDPRITDGYDHYPKNPPQSWTKAPPGTGSQVNVFIVAYYPPPTPYDQNPTWQAVNKQLNANVQMNIVAGSDYRVKLPTIMASGDLPDIIHLFTGMLAGPNLPDFFESACADLTPYLSGDAVKDYPNLAAIPTYAWKNSICAVNGKLFMWPIHRYLPGLTYFFRNTDIYDKEIGPNYVPKDADDFKKVLQELNKPDQNRWAIGNVALYPFNYGIGGYAAMFGAPYFWGKDASGKLVRDRETEQYKAAVGYARDLWSMGLIWANAPTATMSRPDFAAGHFVLSVEGYGNSWNDFWRQGLQQNPPNHFDLVTPFTASAGDKPIGYITGGYISTNVMKKASPDRIRELLRIVDYLAAPFGTQEDLLLTYGVAGQDYTLNADGDPVTSREGIARAGYVPWRYISQHPYVQYQADLPGYAKKMSEVEPMLVAEGVADATLGYYSKTFYAAQGQTAETTFFDGINDIITGRRPMSDYDGLVQDWRNSAGEQIRTEYTQAMEAAA